MNQLNHHYWAGASGIAVLPTSISITALRTNLTEIHRPLEEKGSNYHEHE